MALSGPQGSQRTLTIYRDGESFDVTVDLVNPSTLTRDVRLTVHIPEAAQHAARALEVLGCSVTRSDKGLSVRPDAQVNPADLDLLIGAGEEKGIWTRIV